MMSLSRVSVVGSRLPSSGSVLSLCRYRNLLSQRSFSCLVKSPTFRSALRFTNKAPPTTRYWTLITVPRLTKHCRGYYHLAWLPSLTFLDQFKLWRKHTDHTLSPEILANIPAEVLRKDTLKSRVKKRSRLGRWLYMLLEFVRFTLRLMRVMLTFTPLVVAYPFVCWTDRTKMIYWKVLLWNLESLGTTYIKLGQWAGTRRDLFSPEFCDLFSTLHVSTMVHSWAVTKRKLRKAFGKRWREIIVRIHKKPIGSGCIAQVYKAYMPADMIPDEALADEIMEQAESESDDEPEIDFAEGLEIHGWGHDDHHDDDCDEHMADYTKHMPRKAVTATTNNNHSSYENPDTEEVIETEDEAYDARPPESTQLSTHSDDTEDEPHLVPVAVKVLHPGVYPTVQRDLRILRLLTAVAERIFPSLKWLSLSECMTEFSGLLLNQIDLRMEAECLEIFNENFADHPNIRFPKPVWPYCRRGVLIETFEEGEPIANYLTEGTEPEIPMGLNEKLASFGVDALLQMVFVDNFVHGDLHPGNILVQNIDDYIPEEESKYMLVDVGDCVIVNVKPIDCPVRLVLLDVGITASLGEIDMENLRNVFTAVVIGDGETVADLMLRHARHNECKNVQLFKQELKDLVMEARRNSISLGQVQVGKLLSDVFRVLSRHKVKLESNFASIFLAIFVLEGLGRSLDPDLDILEKARPILLSS